jgi:serine/threonine protein kinase
MIGTQVGQFVIQRLLGTGGMGTVYLAEHALLKTPRAVKVLLPEWTKSKIIVQRFVNEARAAAAIRHRNIIVVHDVGQLPSGQWFIVLDYVEGQTLEQFIRRSGPIPPDRIVHIASEIANGLQAAHDHQIVHRDLKPDNIYLSARDGDEYRATILDFGVARLGAERAGLVTCTGTVIGTPAFMAPEQLRGEKVGPAADIFALGVIAYQMTTGGWLPYQDASPTHAYYALTPAEIYHRQMSGPPVDPRRHAPNTGEAWVRALGAALAVDPARRPPTAGAFARLLAEAVPGDGRCPSGLEIVRAYARELLAPGAEHDAARAPAWSPRHGGGSRYRLGPKLGTGGMAEVFLGTVIGAEGFARQVAIKRVLADHSEEPKFASMFVEEARIASQLSHPNVVSVLDFDRDPEGRLFLVMEFVDGKDLEALYEAGRLPPSIAIFVVSEILRGLGYAHELPRAGGVRGYVHRDVSPHNVLVSWEGAVKVSDFGIAKALEHGGGARSAIVKGKPAYMSPEQVNAEALDGRSDLFAVGILLWELLAGMKLFSGGAREAFAKILFHEVPRPGELAAGVPADLEAVAMKLLARDREDRYPTAEAAIEDLARCADNPRNGRSELVRWMAHRFPADAQRRMQPPTRQERAAPPPGAPEPLVTTLDAAASQSTPHAGPGVARARPRWLGAAVATCAVAAAITAALATRAASTEQRAAEAGDREPGLAVQAPPPLPPPAPPPPVQPPPVPRSPDRATEEVPRPERARAMDRSGPAVSPERPPTPSRRIERGGLVVRVRPWAEVWIDGVPAGQTPVQTTVRAGAHRVLLRNDHKQKAVTVSVTAARETVIEEVW